MTKEMTEAGTRDSVLRWEVFVAPGIPSAATDLPPGTKQGVWPPISSTLIYGKQDAVLVDAFILGEMRRYIRDFVRLAMQTAIARELYDEMLKLYPDWGNRGALWTSVRAIKT